MSKKKIILSILCIIILVFGLIVIFNSNKEEEKPKILNNKSSKKEISDVVKDAKIKGLDLKNISITFTKETGSTYTAKIINNTQETISLESFDVTFKDKDDNVLTTITLFVGGDVLPKQENVIKSTFLEDVTNATKVEYKIN